jgi:predicted deacylase
MTVEGRPVNAVAVRSSAGVVDEGRPQVMVVACIHGVEVISSELALAILAEVCAPTPEGAAAALLDEADLTVVPCVNVDGRTAAVGSLSSGRLFARAPRVNANGVDLNRNWPFPDGTVDHWSPLAGTSIRRLPWYRGPEPLSEPESAGLAALAERVRPLALLNLHSTGCILTHPWSAKPEPPADQAGFDAMIAAFRATQRFHWYRSKQSRAWYPILGSSNDWFYDRFGTLAMTVEVSAPAASVKADPRRAGRAFWYANPTDPQRWIDNDLAGCFASLLAAVRWRRDHDRGRVDATAS